ncbi:MAG: hypothetical protein K0S28_1576, partial [Paucimonas sp.]|nr:hypothetical protein [Paucimonas sp.]
MTLLSSLRMRPMSRDKANTLLLIAACSVALLPHVVRVPAWVAATCVLLMCWRAWITLRGNRLPPRWLLLPAAAVLMAASYMHFGTWFGRDAGVAMLLILMALKLLEMHARSDFWVSIFLSYFLILAQYFFSQTIATATMTAFAVVLLLTTQLSFQYTGIVPPFRKRLRAAAVCCLLALPIAAVLFVLFPRLQGPLWGLPKDAHSGRTGLSDTMTPGNISRL